jgi:hypothetical protein
MKLLTAAPGWAAVELRRLFPAITDTAQARACARTIAGWKPLPPRVACQPVEPRHRHHVVHLKLVEEAAKLAAVTLGPARHFAEYRLATC